MLTIHVNSFSYAKGIPAPPHGHGCGFVFDCRGIENPGLLPELSPQTGLDFDVQYFLTGKTTMPDFLIAIKTIIDISVTKYLERGFTDLSINFGCTGGRHRSVYAAETITNYLRNKNTGPVKVMTVHTNI